MKAQKKKMLTEVATRIRIGAVTAVHSAASGHPGGSLSIADILAYLYFSEMKIDPEKPDWADRDRFVLSKGHAAPALYAALAERGYFDPALLTTLRQVDSILQGHPDMKHIPGVDMSTGSLGQGISAACGMALAGKTDHRDYRVYAIVGDGESEEGQVWEAAMFAAHYHLDNLCVFLDANGLQIDGRCADVMNPAPHDEKFRAFGWHVITIDAHNFDEIGSALAEAKTVKGQPTLILARSVKGKGVSYMENQVGWHGKAPGDAEFDTAMKCLKGQEG